MARGKKRRKLNRKIVFLFLFIISVSFTYSFVKELTQYFTLNANIAEALAKQEDLKTQKEDLEIKKENLNDPEYLLRYARGKYLVTKDDGEQVFKLPEE